MGAKWERRQANRYLCHRKIQNCQLSIPLNLCANPTDYGLASEDDDRRVADCIWNNFLGGQSNSRPLNNADGLDFDIGGGQGQPFYVALVSRVHEDSGTTYRKIFDGLPASQAAAVGGFVPPVVLSSQIQPSVKELPSVEVLCCGTSTLMTRVDIAPKSSLVLEFLAS
ncbi:hypothetical protein FNV43_RR10532 [Rhamnella rubrinervis]|uniref:Uncharacterized protein n=1 Tax=Rhamnella rubrinervis TaxID=2594499 RepID=A0A8K0MGT1_9ROSA|nr:hypothetical protein FNV43_RR10532 [Rhamnella rubrinervis]